MERDPFEEDRVKEVMRDLHDRRAQRRYRRHLDDIREIVSSPKGRRVLYRLLDESRITAASFVAGQPDVTNFNEGKRDIGIWLLTDLMKASPDAYAQMVREKSSEEKEDAAEEKRINEEAKGNGN